MRDPDPEQLDAVVGRLGGDLGASITGALTGLGAQAGETRPRQVAAEAGFRHFRRATETPFNLVIGTRP